MSSALVVTDKTIPHATSQLSETVTTDRSLRNEHRSLAKAYDWGARRTWLVFLGLAVGHGFVAGALDPLARTLPLYVFRIADLEIVEFVTIFVIVALIFGWWISLEPPLSVASSPRGDVQLTRSGRRVASLAAILVRVAAHCDMGSPHLCRCIWRRGHMPTSDLQHL